MHLIANRKHYYVTDDRQTDCNTYKTMLDTLSNNSLHCQNFVRIWCLGKHTILEYINRTIINFYCKQEILNKLYYDEKKKKTFPIVVMFIAAVIVSIKISVIRRSIVNENKIKYVKFTFIERAYNIKVYKRNEKTI